MSWTYISQLDEYDKEVTKDKSVSDRWTFNRYMYFKPDQYDKWSKGQSYTGVPYSAELIGNPNIPSAGTYLTGSLSSFYVNDIVSINNLTEEEHGDACSYAVVIIEYENKAGSSGSGSSSERVDYPWNKPVDDFSIVSQELQIPFTQGKKEGSNDVVPVATTAGQVLYGFTTSIYTQRLTWTYNCLPGDTYGITAPIVNNRDYTLFSVFTIATGTGLLLPPGYKRMWYYKNGSSNGTRYSQWSFEIIVNPLGWDLEILNAGTQAKFNNNLVDVCSWYVFDPTQQNAAPQKQYGSFNDMMSAKRAVDAHNKNITDKSQHQIWHGDYVQNPVPLTENGEVDTGAIANPANTFKLKYKKYDKGSWNLGTR